MINKNIRFSVINAIIKKFLQNQKQKSQYIANFNRRVLNWRKDKTNKSSK